MVHVTQNHEDFDMCHITPCIMVFKFHKTTLLIILIFFPYATISP